MAKKVNLYRGAEIWRNNYKSFVGVMIFPKKKVYKDEIVFKSKDMSAALKKAKNVIDGLK